MKKLVRVACAVVVFGALAACGGGDDDDMPNGSGNGTGGAAPGTGGMVGAGTGGMVAAGTGGMGMAGTGGMSTAGTGGGSASMDSCATADMAMTPAQLHMEAASLLSAMTPCAFGGCHGGATPAALLNLEGAMDLRSVLVDKMSCLAPDVPLVDGSGGDAALKNSWLWIKLTGPVTVAGGVTEQPGWGTPGTCGQDTAYKYGERMPRGIGTDMSSATRLAKVRNWICAGAPGPQ